MKKNLYNYFLNDIEQAMKLTKELDLKIDEGKNEGPEQKHEIQIIMNDLKKIQAQVLTNSLPNKENRFVLYEHFITEKWGIRHPLGSKLLDISTKYTDSF